ncbi:sRNA-binding protein [Bradyrhizobium elkanii]|nr:sRNA-binding protein [Bradyrhizobium elkanii]
MGREPSPRADALRAQREARFERMQAQKRELDARDAAAAAAAKESTPMPAAKRSPAKKRSAAKKRRSAQNRS